MRLVDFLIFLLEAQAQTLQRLAAIFGEEEILEILENADDPDKLPKNVLRFNPSWFDSSATTGLSSAYSELEAAVHEFHLPSFLEFHLWAYPHYRAFIESSLDLRSRIQGPGAEAGAILVDEAVAQAQGWIKKLPMPPSAAVQAERAANIPWLRFRSEVLKRIGKRPMGPVY